MRRIGRRSGIKIEQHRRGCRPLRVPGPSRGNRRIAIPIVVVRRAATFRELMPPRRLRILPGHRKFHAACGRLRSARGVNATGRGRARVVVNKKYDLPRFGVRVNIFSRDGRLSSAFLRGHPRTINSRAEMRGNHAVKPGEQVRHLVRLHRAALFLIEKNHGAARKPFALSGSDGGFCIARAKRGRMLRIFQFALPSSIEEHEQSKSILQQDGAFARPRVRCIARLFPWRRIQPVARKRKRLLQQRERSVAGIIVRVEAEIGGRAGSCVLFFLRNDRRNARGRAKECAENQSAAAAQSTQNTQRTRNLSRAGID